MRSPIGVRRINLFIDFLKIWYTQDELFESYNKRMEEIENVSNIHDAKKILSHACYLKDARKDGIILLNHTIRKYIELEDTETAFKELQKSKIETAKTKNADFKTVRQFVEAYTELSLYLMLDKQNKKIKSLKSFLKKKIAQIKPLILNEKKDSNIIFETLHLGLDDASKIFEILGDYQSSLESINLSIKIEKCDFTIAQKAIILIWLHREEEASKILNENVLEDIEPVLIAKLRVNKILKNKNEVIKFVDILLQNDIYYLPHCIQYLVEFDDGNLIKKHLPKFLEKINQGLDSFQDKIIATLIESVIHQSWHAISDKNFTKVDYLLKILSKIKKYLTNSNVISLIVAIAADHRPIDKENILDILIQRIEKNLGSEYAEALKPLKVALKFLKTKDMTLLESLHKEQRELVINIVEKIDKKIKLPQQVYNSLIG